MLLAAQTATDAVARLREEATKRDVPILYVVDWLAAEGALAPA